MEGYQHARADEDTVTGALGQALLGPGAFPIGDGRVVTWSTSYTRMGSSGPENPAEKRYGADGIFEIEVTDDDRVTTRKSLLFQAKKEAYTFGNARLRKQAKKIASVPGGGIVIDYRPGSFVAVDAGAVSRADEGVDEEPLERALESFVVCHRGSSAYYYEPDRELIHVVTVDGGLVISQFPLSHRIRTKCLIYPFDRNR